MKKQSKLIHETASKQNLHPRNKHRSVYDFKLLIAANQPLMQYVFTNQYNTQTIDFSNPAAVKELNRALLKLYYKVSYWDIPENYLCPPIPGRADYIHYIADLLSATNDHVLAKGNRIEVLDIGVGANCIYPIIGHSEYGWKFTGSDIDPVSIRSANRIIEANSSLTNAITCRIQPSASHIFIGIVQKNDLFDVTICNPPFHASLQDAQAGTNRKLKNLGLSKKPADKLILNFGGQRAELWCPGGELTFIKQMINESAEIPFNCLWFSTLISKKENLEPVYHALRYVKAKNVQTIAMKQGQKISRIVAWTFQNQVQQQEWRSKRW